MCWKRVRHNFSLAQCKQGGRGWAGRGTDSSRESWGKPVLHTPEASTWRNNMELFPGGENRLFHSYSVMKAATWGTLSTWKAVCECKRKPRLPRTELAENLDSKCGIVNIQHFPGTAHGKVNDGHSHTSLVIRVTFSSEQLQSAPSYTSCATSGKKSGATQPPLPRRLS